MIADTSDIKTMYKAYSRCMFADLPDELKIDLYGYSIAPPDTSDESPDDPLVLTRPEGPDVLLSVEVFQLDLTEEEERAVLGGDRVNHGMAFLRYATVVPIEIEGSGIAAVLSVIESMCRTHPVSCSLIIPTCDHKDGCTGHDTEGISLSMLSPIDPKDFAASMMFLPQVLVVLRRAHEQLMHRLQRVQQLLEQVEAVKRMQDAVPAGKQTNNQPN